MKNKKNRITPIEGIRAKTDRPESLEKLFIRQS
jgi:hypothetical protein